MSNQTISAVVEASAAEFSRALVIDRVEYRALRECVRTALEILEIAVGTVRADPKLQAMAVANYPHGDKFAAFIDDPVEAIGRFDAFVDTDGVLRFLEYNPGICGGAFNSYRAAQVFLESEPGRRLARTARLEATPTPDLYVEAVREGCREAIGRDALTVALIFAGEPEAPSREMAAFAAGLGLRGGECVSVSVEDVTRRDGALWFGDRRIDAAFVMNWADMNWAGNPLIAPLTQTWMANTLGAAVFRGGKHLYAVMSDPSLGAPLDAAQRAWVDKHIPWTRMLPTGAATDPAAKALRTLVLERQKDLIIKPSLGRGGKGIVAGWAVSEAAWREAVDSPTADSCLVQERVFPRLEAPFDDSPPDQLVFADLCMFIWGNRRPEGIVSRASRGWLLNVSAGEAKAVPVLIRD